MSSRILVLGAGRVGRVIARDLHDDPTLDVTVADVRGDTLAELAGRHGFKTQVADLSDPAEVYAAVRGYDLAVGALPGDMGLRSMEAVIDAGTRYVDISFMAEDPRHLADRARDRGVPVVYDIGLAPGTSNVLLAQAVRRLAPARFARYIVGGLPFERRLPWEYEAPFSPIDVVEEYTRPARFVSGGEQRVRPALSDLEHFHFEPVGTLEGFLTDGLRSMLDTIDCPHVEEKTLRYPGHAERVRVLRDSGLFDDREVTVDGKSVNVRKATFAVLDKAWSQPASPNEFTVMRIEAEGGPEGNRRIVWDLFDRTDPERGETSMARTTGFPAAICARAMLDGSLPVGPGVHPPEALAGDDAFVQRLLDELEKRGVSYRQREETADRD